jgi:NAD(P)-dependent dehydrogenase (short-subunit alcohol dehydrogenase family)
MTTETRSFARVQLVDPREAYPKPPFRKQSELDLPAGTGEMNPRPDHGESSYRGNGKLKGLTSIVTGGDSGIGRAVALAYAAEGAKVAIVYHQSTEDAESTAELIREKAGEVIVIQGDLKSEPFCMDVIEQVVDHFGALEILVNNAAYQQTEEELEEFSTKDFDDIFKTNVYAPFWLARAALSKIPPGGSIINTVSIQAYSPSPELLPYAASKAALLGMTKGLAKLAIEHGVRVNAVAPGPVWTPLIPATVGKEKTRNFGDNTLFKRPAQPVELAPLFVWLASPEASYVTSEVFAATGGRTPY